MRRPAASSSAAMASEESATPCPCAAAWIAIDMWLNQTPRLASTVPAPAAFSQSDQAGQVEKLGFHSRCSSV